MKSIYLGQKGNAMMFVLIGIALFAALTFTFSRSTRNSKISLEDAQFAAQQIIGFAQKVSRGMETVSFNNDCLSSQISFENTTVAGYTNAAAPANKKCHIFDSAGGGTTYEAPPTVALDTASAATASAVPLATGALVGQYLFTGRVCVDGQGTGALATCAADALSNEELLLIMPWVSLEVCTTINSILGNSAAILQEPNSSFDATKFTGAFADGYALGQVGFTTYKIGCYQSTSAATPGAGYHFYAVLLAR